MKISKVIIHELNKISIKNKMLKELLILSETDRSEKHTKNSFKHRSIDILKKKIILFKI